MAQWGDGLKAFCDALGIERPIVYGASFGGMVALAYATRHRIVAGCAKRFRQPLIAPRIRTNPDCRGACYQLTGAGLDVE